MVYLLKMVIFGYVSHNQMVYDYEDSCHDV